MEKILKIYNKERKFSKNLWVWGENKIMPKRPTGFLFLLENAKLKNNFFEEDFFEEDFSKIAISTPRTLEHEVGQVIFRKVGSSRNCP